MKTHQMVLSISVPSKGISANESSMDDRPTKSSNDSTLELMVKNNIDLMIKINKDQYYSLGLRFQPGFENKNAHWARFKPKNSHTISKYNELVIKLYKIPIGSRLIKVNQINIEGFQYNEIINLITKCLSKTNCVLYFEVLYRYILIYVNIAIYYYNILLQY